MTNREKEWLKHRREVLVEKCAVYSAQAKKRPEPVYQKLAERYLARLTEVRIMCEEFAVDE